MLTRTRSKRLLLADVCLCLRYDGTAVKKIRVKLGAAGYDVLIANGLLRNAGKLIRARCGVTSHVLVVTSPRIRRVWGKQLETSLRSAHLPFSVLTIPDGEQH